MNIFNSTWSHTLNWPIQREGSRWLIHFNLASALNCNWIENCNLNWKRWIRTVIDEVTLPRSVCISLHDGWLKACGFSSMVAHWGQHVDTSLSGVATAHSHSAMSPTVRMYLFSTVVKSYCTVFRDSLSQRFFPPLGRTSGCFSLFQFDVCHVRMLEK